MVCLLANVPESESAVQIGAWSLWAATALAILAALLAQHGHYLARPIHWLKHPILTLVLERTRENRQSIPDERAEENQCEPRAQGGSNNSFTNSPPEPMMNSRTPEQVEERVYLLHVSTFPVSQASGVEGKICRGE